MKHRWVITVEPDGTCWAECPRTGELRELQRGSIESALRTLGRTIDNDRRMKCR